MDDLTAEAFKVLLHGKLGDLERLIDQLKTENEALRKVAEAAGAFLEACRNNTPDGLKSELHWMLLEEAWGEWYGSD